MNTKLHLGRKIQFNLLMISSIVIFVPAGLLIGNAVYLRPAAADAMQPPLTPVSLLSKPNKAPGSDKLLAVSKREEKTQLTKEGNMIKETFDADGKRVSKTLSSPEGVLLNRWDFEPKKGKILRYEVNDYKGTQFVQRRVARWQYSEDGGFVKTNQSFDIKATPVKFFVETVNGEGVKYQEEWVDEKKRVIAEKLWDYKTGSFESSFIVEYMPGQWMKKIYLDEKGAKLRETLVSPDGTAFSAKHSQ